MKEAPATVPTIGEMAMSFVEYENRQDFPKKGAEKSPSTNGPRYRRGPGSSPGIRNWKTARPAVVRDGKLYLADAHGIHGARITRTQTGLWERHFA